MKQVTIGIAGAGRALGLHMEALKWVHGVQLRYKSVMGRRPEQVEPAREKYGFEKAVYDYEELLQDPEIDVIHICTPPYTHEDMTVRALKAGKHVVCEKPFIGYFDADGDTPAGFVSKAHMYEDVLRRLDEVRELVRSSGKKLMYADNAVYASSVMRAADFITAKKSKILYIKGEESLKGSSSPVSGHWAMTGGGTFSRNGAHPLAAALWLKQQEAKARGEEITVKSVMADMDMISPSLTEYEHRHIDARPVDVEDIGTAVITFSDNSRAVIMATNIYLGGLKNYLELYCNDATYECRLTTNNTMSTYFMDEDGIQDMRLSELLPSKLGWNNAFVADEQLRGYIGEMQDFMECVCSGREPMSGVDLAYEATRVIYAAYLSAEKGSVVYL